ncbi:MAG: putative lipopolysaccharide heptosyltransferase III [Chthoniobacterales bacterium]
MKILLIQLKRIGDLILTTPAVAALRRRFPDAQITLAVSSAGEELLPAIREINQAVVLRGSAADTPVWLRVAAANFTYCFDFTRNDRASFLTLASHARHRVTAKYVELQSKVRARFYNELVPVPMRFVHTIDSHLGLLEPLGIDEEDREIRLQLPEMDVQASDKLLTEAGITGEFVAVHPGSARAEKFWEPDRWATVIDHISRNHDLPCVVTGGAAPLEKQHIAAITSSGRAPVVDLSGKTNLLGLAAVVKRARLLLTVDSAPMHFAAAFHTPQVDLFGPTNPFHWRPFAENALILQGDSGVPMTEYPLRQRRLRMNLISTQAVIDAMETLLSASAASRL